MAREPRPQEGELVKVFEDDRRNPVYWFQPTGKWRSLYGVQVFLDARRRTRAVVEGPEVTAGHRVVGRSERPEPDKS